MLEAELLGFEPGAFTDAKRAKPGLFEAASRGTLLLDEVDALPLTWQSKLLTAIESRQMRCLGAVVERAVDVKLIAATNAVNPEVVAAGQFRADLYHPLPLMGWNRSHIALDGRRCLDVTGCEVEPSGAHQC